MPESAPLYHQVAEQIHALIRAGTLRPGERVPSVRRLSRQRRQPQPFQPATLHVRQQFPAAQPQAKREIIGHTAPQQNRALKHHRHPSPLRQRQRRRPDLPIKDDLPLGRLLQKIEQPQQRTFARPARPHNCQNFAALNVQLSYVQDTTAVVPLLHIFQLIE